MAKAAAETPASDGRCRIRRPIQFAAATRRARSNLASFSGASASGAKKPRRQAASTARCRSRADPSSASAAAQARDRGRCRRATLQVAKPSYQGRNHSGPTGRRQSQGGR